MAQQTKTTPFQLLQWKHAIKLEKVGMQVTRGRKVTPHAKKFFGLKRNVTHDTVIEHIDAALTACKEAGATPTQVVEFG
jgi:hypothetical protein